MAELENPSAGKFGPPPENERRERVRLGGPQKPRSLWPVLLVVTLLALQYFFESQRGWGSAVAVLVAAAGFAAEQFFDHQARGGPDPYTPPTHITR